MVNGRSLEAKLPSALAQPRWGGPGGGVGGTPPLTRIRRALLILLLATHAAWAAEPALPPAGDSPSWGWLGVRIRDLSEQEMEELTVRYGLGEGYGVLLVDVLKGGPAETIGLKAGDLVVAYDGRPILEVRALQRFVGATPAGKSASLTVLREGKRRPLQVTIGAMPTEVVAERVAAEYGFAVRALVGERSASERGDDPVVAVVMERSPAKQAGLQVGDRIVRFNGQAVTSLATLGALLRRQRLREPLDLHVLREGNPLSLHVPPAVPDRALP